MAILEQIAKQVKQSPLYKQKTVPPVVTSNQVQHEHDGMALLMDGMFLPYCTDLITSYHAGDEDLTMLLLRSGIRAAYSSNSGLFHVSCTGESGSGKNDLMAQLAALIPAKNLASYSSISPKALYLATRKVGVGADGKQFNYVDSFSFLNKIIMVTEIADSKAYDALKAFAETDEQADFTHATGSGQMNLELTVTGPRALWITSVTGPKDDQVNRRFVHARITKQTQTARMDKLDLMFDNTVGDRHITTDPRTPLAQAMFRHMFIDNGYGAVKLQSSPETNRKYKRVVHALGEAGYNTTAVKQFMTLCECGAFEKRFQRTYIRIEMEDIREAFYLICAFDRGRVVDEIETGFGEVLTPKHPLYKEEV